MVGGMGRSLTARAMDSMLYLALAAVAWLLVVATARMRRRERRDLRLTRQAVERLRAHEDERT
jgi:hypothetical protein